MCGSRTKKNRQHSVKLIETQENSTKLDKTRQNSAKLDKTRQNSTKLDKIGFFRVRVKASLHHSAERAIEDQYDPIRKGLEQKQEC